MSAARAIVVGLDFGTTTSSALVGEAEVRRGIVTGRMELADLRETFRSPLCPTPIVDGRLDLAAAEALLDGWLAEAAIDPARLVGGGALVTGLTARRDNAPGLVAAIRARVGEALVATADDPCLESWMAFQGGCAALSRRHPGEWFVNVDIGGGTSNLALGRDGEVHCTGCLAVGARHLRLAPGTRRVEEVSPRMSGLLRELGVAAAPGGELGEADVERIVEAWCGILERAVLGTLRADAPLVDVPLRPGIPPRELADARLTLSGGVGELVGAAAAGGPLPGIAAFGDLGVDLARAILAHPRLGQRVRATPSPAGGRATVIGLLRRTVHLSGTSIHLPDPGILPLPDLPIAGSFSPCRDDAALDALVALARRRPAGAALRISGVDASAAAVAAVAERIAAALRRADWPATTPLVILLDADVGKALGACATRFGTRSLPLVVVDGIDVPLARFASLGTPRAGAVPVAFHGLET